MSDTGDDTGDNTATDRAAEIARDDSLPKSVRLKLMDVAAAEAAAGAESVAAVRSVWLTPLAIALTGLITLTGNFAFDYWRAAQTGDISQSQAAQDAENAREIARQNAEAERQLQRDSLQAQQQQAALSFQYEVIKAELETRSTAEDRADALHFLVRVGILGEPLKLAEITKIIAEVREGDASALPPVGASGQVRHHDYSPCDDTRVIARLTPDLLADLHQTHDFAAPPDARAPAFLAAMRRVYAENGICTPRLLAAMVAPVLVETEGLSTFEATVDSAEFIYDRYGADRGNLMGSKADAIKYRSRGLAMLTFKPVYSQLAAQLNRPELLENPALLVTDPEFSADVMMALFRNTGLPDRCNDNACDFRAIALRTSGGFAQDRMAELAEAIRIRLDTK